MLRTFIARLDNSRAHPKNFAGGEFCLRLTGFAKRDLRAFQQPPKPVTIVQIEVDVGALFPPYPLYPLKRWSRIEFTPHIDDEKRLLWSLHGNGFGPFVNDGWVEIDILENPQGRDYFYPLFSDDGFINGKVLKIVAHPSLNDFCNLMALAPADNVIAQTKDLFRTPVNSDYHYYGMYVGQGMATFLQSDNPSHPTIFFDLGGGTPLLKKDYHKVSLALHKRLSTADNYLILSHWDSDHWRLMCWDQALMNRVEWYAPDTNLSDPSFRDPRIQQSLLSKKLMLCSAGIVGSVANNMRFECFRHPDLTRKNHDGIYTIINRGNAHGSQEALMTGDLPYGKVRAAVGAGAFDYRFSSVVVPHHGDSESRNHVPLPAATYPPIAFFSAGDHAGYGHPKAVSISAHHQYQRINCRANISANFKKLMDAELLL